VNKYDCDWFYPGFTFCRLISSMTISWDYSVRANLWILE